MDLARADRNKHGTHIIVESLDRLSRQEITAALGLFLSRIVEVGLIIDSTFDDQIAVAKVPVLRVEIVKRSDDMKGFVVLPRRWVVERTFSWFGRNRRLAKDFENLAETLATFVTLACIQLAVRRLARV